MVFQQLESLHSFKLEEDDGSSLLSPSNYIAHYNYQQTTLHELHSTLYDRIYSTVNDGISSASNIADEVSYTTMMQTYTSLSAVANETSYADIDILPAAVTLKTTPSYDMS